MRIQGLPLKSKPTYNQRAQLTCPPFPGTTGDLHVPQDVLTILRKPRSAFHAEKLLLHYREHHPKVGAHEKIFIDDGAVVYLIP